MIVVDPPHLRAISRINIGFAKMLHFFVEFSCRFRIKDVGIVCSEFAVEFWWGPPPLPLVGASLGSRNVDGC